MFTVPSELVGKNFICKLMRLFSGFAYSVAIETIAFTATMVAPSLLLQKPHPKAKTTACVTCLQRRLEMWRTGNIDELIREGRAIQHRLLNTNKPNMHTENGQQFAKLIHQGRIRAALRLLDSTDSSVGTLPLDERIAGVEGKSTVLAVIEE